MRVIAVAPNHARGSPGWARFLQQALRSHAPRCDVSLLLSEDGGGVLHQRRCTDAARLGRAPAREMAACILHSERPRLQSTEDEIAGVARQAAEIRDLQAENTLGGEPVGDYVEGVVESLRQRAE